MTKGHYDKLAFALEPLKFNMLMLVLMKVKHRENFHVHAIQFASKV